MLSQRPPPTVYPDPIETGFVQSLKRLPWVMLVIMMLLGGIGVLALYSAAGGSWSPWSWKHLIRLAAGFVLMVMVASVPIRFYQRFAFPGWLLAVLVLVLVEFIGSGSGVQRWISVGGFNLQPSEPAKLAVIMLLAAWFNDMNPDMIRYLRSYVPVLAIVLIPFGLVLAQPDLGTAIMLLGAAAAVVFIAGIPSWMIGVVIASILLAVPVIWAQLYQYQKDRILVFLNPGADQLGAGYQIIQSKIALGSGGFLGKGYLQGSQSRLNYLPEKQTDFVFTMIGEEFGFLGCSFIIGLYALLIFQMIRTGLSLSLNFSRMVVIGVATMLFFYVFVNVGMVTGVLPVGGAPLPLISYGGTALMTVFIGMGLIISAIMHDEGRR